MVATRDGKVALVLVAWRIGGVDDFHARRIHRDHAGNGVIILPRFHGFGRDRHELMTHGRGRDVQFGATDDNPVVAALDDPHVGIRIVLIAGAPAAVPLGVGNTLGDAQITLLHVFDVITNPRSILGQLRFDAIRGRQQRHDRRIRDMSQQVYRLVQLNLLAQLLPQSRVPP